MVSALVRSQRASYGANVPHSFVFDGPSRLLFLGADASLGPEKPSTSLYAIGLPPLTTASREVETTPAQASSITRPHSVDDYPTRSWTAIIDADEPDAKSQDGQFSKAELLLRERLRTQATGVTFFKSHPSGSLLLPIKGCLFKASFPSLSHSAVSDSALSTQRSTMEGAKACDNTQHLPSLQLKPLMANMTRKQESCMNPTFSPDGLLVSFVLEGDLWVVDVASGYERRLTFSENPSQDDIKSEQVRTDAPSIKQASRSARQPTRKEYEEMVESAAAARCASQSDNVTKASSNAGVRLKTNGAADYITQEEFGRHHGAWWRPEKNDKTGNYEILYLQVDQTNTPVVSIPTYQVDGAVDRYHYPRPGEQNCVSEPAVVAIPPPPPASEHDNLVAWSDEDPRDVADSYSWAPDTSVRAQFPWSEYVVRAGWLASHPVRSGADGVDDSALFWLQLLSRQQRRTEFVVFPAGGSGRGIPVSSDLSIDHWINVSDAYHFLVKERGLLFCSERTGFAHLYYKDLSALSSLTQHANNIQKDITNTGDIDGDGGQNGGCLSSFSETCGVLPGEFRPITAGDDWMVEEIEFVDEERKLVYISSTMGSPLERQLCAASYDKDADASDIQMLTSPGSTYSRFAFNRCGTRLVANFSATTRPTTTLVYDVEGLVEHVQGSMHLPCQKVRQIKLTKILRIANPTGHPSSRAPWKVRPPSLFTFRADDDTLLHGTVYYPTKLHDTDPEPGPGPYATVLVVYGGPRVQTVRNEWEITMQLKNQMLAAHGYAVVMIDGRGSYRRGTKFENVFSSGFGAVEIRDQVRGIEHMIASGVVDPCRIACSGWSYGAFACCQLLANYGNIFRIAICGAAVVLWEGYDAAYTERYLGLPNENPEAYTSSSLIARAAQFPDMDGRLLLVASLKDENVHCTQTIALVDALVKLNKPHRLLIFPREQHGLRDSAARLHFESTFFSFIANL
jgi:Prolyl oligopeptidase family/Dipeptidyl peptidase IV (DPP IV) N-terminal region